MKFEQHEGERNYLENKIKLIIEKRLSVILCKKRKTQQRNICLNVEGLKTKLTTEALKDPDEEDWFEVFITW